MRCMGAAATMKLFVRRGGKGVFRGETIQSFS